VNDSSSSSDVAIAASAMSQTTPPWSVPIGLAWPGVHLEDRATELGLQELESHERRGGGRRRFTASHLLELAEVTRRLRRTNEIAHRPLLSGGHGVRRFERPDG
jgi:hypothetical protein